MLSPLEKGGPRGIFIVHPCLPVGRGEKSVMKDCFKEEILAPHGYIINFIS